MKKAAIAIVLLAAASVGQGRAQDELAAAQAAAHATARSAEGRKYGEAVGQAFGREHGATIKRCAKDAKRSDIVDFDLLVRVDGAGVVDRALATPATTLSACVEAKLAGWKVPAPPQPGFWVQVDVHLKGN